MAAGSTIKSMILNAHGNTGIQMNIDYHAYVFLRSGDTMTQDDWALIHWVGKVEQPHIGPTQQEFIDNPHASVAAEEEIQRRKNYAEWVMNHYLSH